MKRVSLTVEDRVILLRLLGLAIKDLEWRFNADWETITSLYQLALKVSNNRPGRREVWESHGNPSFLASYLLATEGRTVSSVVLSMAESLSQTTEEPTDHFKVDQARKNSDSTI